MEENNYIVYKHTAPNGKVYIGLTNQTATARWGKNGNGYKNAGYFRNAINKYGWDNIKHEILARGLSQEQAQIAEKKLIKRYDSRNPKKGYNVQAGGSLGWKGMTHTESAREKIRQSQLGPNNWMRGRKQSKEWLEMIRVVNGHPKSEETKQRMREAQSHRSIETRKRLSDAQKKTPVLCVETGEIYPSLVSAAESVKSSPSNLCNCLKGKRHTCMGYHWRYAIDSLEAS